MLELIYFENAPNLKETIKNGDFQRSSMLKLLIGSRQGSEGSALKA